MLIENQKSFTSGKSKLDFQFEDETGETVTLTKFYLRNPRFLKDN